MAHTLETRSSQKMTTQLRLDHKLVTSLQILQMPVKELEQFLEEMLILNPLIPLEQVKSKELLLEDLGIDLEDFAIDPHAEDLFWQSLLQNETEKSHLHDVQEEFPLKNALSPSMAKRAVVAPLFKQYGECEIDLFIVFQGSNWKVISPQPYERLLEKTLLAQKNLPETSPKHTPFWKELSTLQYALSSRKTLLTSLGQEIAAAWNSLFQNGTLSPLDLLETAHRLRRHRTTLFRAIKGKKLFTPRGIFSLEALFEGKRARKARLLKNSNSSHPSSQFP